jgi:hypothetical protein
MLKRDSVIPDVAKALGLQNLVYHVVYATLGLFYGKQNTESIETYL